MKHTRPAASIALVLLLTPLSAHAAAPSAPESIEWLRLDGAVVVPCPEALIATARTEPSCARVDVDPFRFRRLVRKRLNRAARDGPVNRRSWLEEDGFHRLRAFVNARWIDVMISNDGTLAALVTAPSCLGTVAEGLASADELAQEPERLTFARPDYPEAARVVREQGVVVVDTIIGADGRVRHACVVAEFPEGLGFASAALAAVRRWRYEPARIDGEPADVTNTVTVTFELRF